MCLHSGGYLQLCQQQEGSRHAGNARVLPPEEDTWEPRANLLHDVPDVVEAYESKVAATNITADQYAVSTNANEDGCLSDHVNVIENDDLSDHENENENETETDDLSDHVYVIETDSLGDHVMSVGASRLDSSAVSECSGTGEVNELDEGGVVSSVYSETNGTK
ncbi:hypothetical protein PC111_g18848 [Phytophthora cactorum]|nr:hypothetical protein PC111_g18848 [Phytophthora cactorum]